MSSNYDLIVVGAGAMGSAAAWWAARAGQRVLVLEQFALNHERGSSNDHSRIIRYAYDHPVYIELMRAAYELWHKLEDASGETLYIRTGGIDLAHPDQPTFDATTACLDNAGIPYELLTAAEAAARFPVFRFDDDMRVLYQADAGVLRAAAAVRAQQRLAQQHGAVIRSNTPVTGLRPLASGVEVTADQVYTADRLILAAGAWMNDLLSQVGLHLPLEPQGIQLTYFMPAPLAPFTAPHLPVFITHLRGNKSHWVYGIPIERLRPFIHRYLPQADGSAHHTRICLYTMTPDEHFVVDFHPEHPQIVIASACSGHGFKFSPLIGRMLWEMAMLGDTPFDTSLFRLNRFE